MYPLLLVVHSSASIYSYYYINIFIAPQHILSCVVHAKSIEKNYENVQKHQFVLILTMNYNKNKEKALFYQRRISQ